MEAPIVVFTSARDKGLKKTYDPRMETCRHAFQGLPFF